MGAVSSTTKDERASATIRDNAWKTATSSCRVTPDLPAAAPFLARRVHRACRHVLRDVAFRFDGRIDPVHEKARQCATNDEGDVRGGVRRAQVNGMPSLRETHRKPQRQW